MDTTLQLFDRLKYISEPLSVAIAVLGLLVTLIAAFRAGILRSIKVGSLEIEAPAREEKAARELIKAVTVSPTEPIPFETEQLARYYAQVLHQSKISFWFSLIFASLGFLVIVSAAFMYSDSRTGTTVASFIAGLVIDGVAALFFVQSKNAQTSMGQFFDKLRRDRQQVESRKLCESIADEQARDALRVHLALHYAEVSNSDGIAKTITEACLSHEAKEKA